MKCSSEMLQNLLYFRFSITNAQVYVDIDKGIHEGKGKEKIKKEEFH